MSVSFHQTWGTVRSYLKRMHYIFKKYVSTLEKKQEILLSFSIYLEKENNMPRGINHSIHTLFFIWGSSYRDNELSLIR